MKAATRCRNFGWLRSVDTGSAAEPPACRLIGDETSPKGKALLCRSCTGQGQQQVKVAAPGPLCKCCVDDQGWTDVSLQQLSDECRQLEHMQAGAVQLLIP